MPPKRCLASICLTAILVGLTAGGAFAADPKTDADRLSGTWLIDAAAARNDELSRFWTSRLTIDGDSFAVSQFMALNKDVTGKFVLDPSATPKTIDLKIDELNFAAAGAPIAAKISACTLKGIYKLDGERLTISFPLSADGARPADFDVKGDKIARISVVRAPAEFKEFPREITVKVSKPDGQPAAGAIVTGFMHRSPDPKNKDSIPEWTYHPSKKTEPDGTIRVKFDELRFHPIVVRDPENKLMAIAPITPASSLTGSADVTLQPECRVDGSIVADGNDSKVTPILGSVYAMRQGRRVGFCATGGPKFEFVLPPGEYTLDAYGYELSKKIVPITVPPDRRELTLDPIALTPSPFLRLMGNAAPELDGVVGWKGEPAKLADLKGKLVILDFWGYWCGPCVQAMPVLFELHEKYADKGLVIIGVHVDVGGDVDTVAKLDERTAVYKNGIWKGKDVPFPVALTSGSAFGEGETKSGGRAAAQYGVSSYPTKVLIGRDGKVIGRFHAGDIKTASEQIEKLLGNKP